MHFKPIFNPTLKKVVRGPPSPMGGALVFKNQNSKSDSHSVYGDSSCVRRNKYGEVWSSDLGDLDVKSYPLKRIIRKTIFRPLGGAALPNFYTR